MISCNDLSPSDIIVNQNSETTRITAGAYVHFIDGGTQCRDFTYERNQSQTTNKHEMFSKTEIGEAPNSPFSIFLLLTFLVLPL